MRTDYDAIIIGAGAAGLMCALTAGGRGKNILLLDHAEKVGSKILISGGGRCNFTNLGCVPERFISANPHFIKSSLSRYTQHDFITLMDKHRIAYHEKTLGQLFCDGSARAVVAMLLNECRAAHVDVRTSHGINTISKADQFCVDTTYGLFTSNKLVMATGGPSIPKMGATGFAYTVAEQFAVPVIMPRPALVPLTVANENLELCSALSGISVDAQVICGKTSFREKALFTHRGLSGPAVLQISSYWHDGASISIDMASGTDVLAHLKERKRTRPKAEVKTVLAEILPARLAQNIADTHHMSGPMANLTDRHLEHCARAINHWSVQPSGTEGYAKAEVTVGGIDTTALSSKTMQVKAVTGLYFIGEAVDVTGWLGGYNFQWAWSSGWVAGMDV